MPHFNKLLLLLAALLVFTYSTEVCPRGQFYSSVTTHCEGCNSTCDTCTSTAHNSCLNCTSGHYSNGSNTCGFTCPNSSQYLDFNNQSCKACSSSCSHCIESESNCNTCPAGSYYRPDSAGCHSSCPAGVGYHQSYEERRCIPCRDVNCTDCDSNGDCIKCLSFRQLNTTIGRCDLKCSTGCKTCNVTGGCLSCEKGWYLTLVLSGNICTCGFKNCRECGEKSCATCTEGHFVSNATGSCTPCASNCMLCASTSACSVCSPGYYLSNGQCNQCPGGCRYCESANSGSVCNACENGFYMSRTQTCLWVGSPDNTSKPLSAGAIVAIVIGSLVLLIITAVLIRQQIKKRNQKHMTFTQDATAPLDT